MRDEGQVGRALYPRSFVLLSAALFFPGLGKNKAYKAHRPPGHAIPGMVAGAGTEEGSGVGARA
jgi:hypothetical protein